MSKGEIVWNIVFGFIGIGFTVWFFAVAYDRYYYCGVCPFADTAIYLFMAIFLGIGTIWLFTLPYCFTYRVIDDISCENGKFRFNCGGKSFEDASRVFLKFKIYTSEPPIIPTHMFIWLKSGPWLCPFALWKDCVNAVNDKVAK